jgi:hypothetical protein
MARSGLDGTERYSDIIDLSLHRITQVIGVAFLRLARGMRRGHQRQQNPFSDRYIWRKLKFLKM